MKRVSRRHLLAVGGQAFALALLSNCANPAPTPALPSPNPTDTRLPNTPSPSPLPSSPPMPTTATTPKPAAADLDVQIGQMLMLGFRGMTVSENDPIAADLRERHIGSVVLFQYDSVLKVFSRNIESPTQLKLLNDSLQAFAKIPLLVAIDQEGGMVSRLNPVNGFPATQSQKFYGTQNDPAATQAAAEAEGQVLKDAGFNLNLAPVVDLATNPDNPIVGKVERSFSADPKIVTANASAEIEGYHSKGILTTLKHFPGHGSSTSDSHLGFVDVTTTWQDMELDPYRNLIHAGRADAIMTAHIFNANLDPKYPATLSKNIITGILREQLQYDGVVITDDMQMGAIRQYYGYAEAVELAINAGVDILAIANNVVYDPNIGKQTFDIIKQLVKDGKISPERIEQSYQRILRLKARL